MSGEYAAAVLAQRSCIYFACSCFNSRGFLWVARPGLQGGNQAKKAQTVLKFPFWAVILVRSQQRLTDFCVLRPHPLLKVLWQVQVSSSVVLLCFFLLELDPIALWVLLVTSS